MPIAQSIFAAGRGNAWTPQAIHLSAVAQAAATVAGALTVDAGETDDAPTTNQKYVRQGASGSGSGNDWTNAYTSIPATLSRDTTYWFAGGSYGGYTFDDNTSGTQVVRFKKATPAIHGTDTGWSDSYASTQVVFGSITVARGYFVMDGSTRTESYIWGAPAGYGMRATSISSNSSASESAANSLFKYIDIGATWATNPSSGTIAAYGSVLYLVYNQTNVTFSHCAIHNGVGALVYAHGSNGLVFEHCHFSMGWGKEAIAGPNVGINNMVVRWCRFWDSTQTDPNDGTSGLTAEIGAFGGSDPTGNLIYGNVFFNSKSGGRNSCIFFGGGGWSDSAQNCKVFNNTFVDIADSSVYSMILLSGGSGNEARNNLFYNSASTGVTANSASNNVTATVDPFVDRANKDFRIVGGSQADGAGIDVGNSPYNVDPDGTSREGKWSAGAFEVA
jgi:hypothetical protein